MDKFFAELKRRHMYRVAAAYVVVAWILLQLVNNVAPLLHLPDWVGAFFLLVLAAGFPVALIFAWTIELHARRSAKHKTENVDWILTGALGLVIALLIYQQIAPQSGTRTTPASVASGIAAPAGSISIAVLPFTNMSGDAGQEFFSDGMTEEITSALARVQGLTVLGRTSAFQFKGQNKDLREIGQALGATHLIEGSVRKAGTRLRITAQLIRADNGAHLWAENYDRELTDVFAIQEDIAQAIVAALQVPLGMRQGELLVANRKIGPDVYEEYLHAKAEVRTRQPLEATDAIGALEAITAKQPDFAPAWAMLSLAYDVTPQTPAWYSGDVAQTRRIAAQSLPKAEASAMRAIALDPSLAEGYASLGRTQVARGQLLKGDESYSKALALDANNPEALQLYGNLLAETGRLKEAVDKVRRLREVEPYVPIYSANAAQVMWVSGLTNEAAALIETMPPVVARGVDLSEIYASAGRYKDAADQITKIPAGTFYPGIAEEAERLLRSAPAKLAAPETHSRLGILSFAYLYVGAPMRALEFHEDGVDAGYTIAITTAKLWHPSYAPTRKSERFKAFVRKAGLVEYWRARGWPDFCQPQGAEDFSCS